ncbi:hypothetical protein GE061_009593 [Apolygus lucorum]|uniref:Uncharacterized protein n=1 Tax=Apolygus lucorum TaxID=248454 RepID=A0A8S9Y262_APOLU|nr:hypothetical protein GE061_009593 [Apolygus lucorum]
MEIVIMKDVDAKLNSVCAIAEAILESDDFQVKKATKFLKELRLYAVDCFDKERSKLENKSGRKVRGDGNLDSLALELNATRQRAVSVISALETELEFYKDSSVAAACRIVQSTDHVTTAGEERTIIEHFVLKDFPRKHNKNSATELPSMNGK